jgi:hypothetical protein
MFRNISLWSVTWYWNGRLAKMASISWQLHGKGHTSSRLLHDPLHTGLQDLTLLTCPTPSISISLGVFIPNSQIQICTFFVLLLYLELWYIYIYILDYSWLHLFTLLILQLQQLFDKPVHRSPILLGSWSSSVLDLTHSVHEIHPLRFGWSADALWPDQLYSYVYANSDSLTLESLTSPKPYRPTGWHRLRWNN